MFIVGVIIIGHLMMLSASAIPSTVATHFYLIARRLRALGSGSFCF
jgi:hypothetical protein